LLEEVFIGEIFDEPDEDLTDEDLVEALLVGDLVEMLLVIGLVELLLDVDLTELLLDAGLVELLLDVGLLELLLDVGFVELLINVDLVELLLVETLTETLLELLDILVEDFVFVVIHLQAFLTAETFRFGTGESFLSLYQAVSIMKRRVAHPNLLRREETTERRWISELFADCICRRTCCAHGALQACGLCNRIECLSPRACWFGSSNTSAHVQQRFHVKLFDW
jgi:hypothetical protein